MSVATKIAVQMYCKVGVEHLVVQIPLENAMVIGYDTYHDSAQKGFGVEAVVASMNKTFTRYLSTKNIHTNSVQVLVDNMCSAITLVLQKYNETIGCLPAINYAVEYNDQGD